VQTLAPQIEPQKYSCPKLAKWPFFKAHHFLPPLYLLCNNLFHSKSSARSIPNNEESSAQKLSRRASSIYAPFNQQIKFESEQSTHFSTANKIEPSILGSAHRHCHLTIKMQIFQVVKQLRRKMLDKNTRVLIIFLCVRAFSRCQHSMICANKKGGRPF
jgi:hypothetical protein